MQPFDLVPAWRSRSTTFSALLVGVLTGACADSSWRHSEVRESSTTRAAIAGTDDPAVVASDAVTTPAIGAKNPLVVVTVFTDFYCPGCRQLPALLEPLLLHYGSVLQIQYRQRPPLDDDPRARAPAIAALAAHRQGGYACFSGELYRTHGTWTRLSGDPFEGHLSHVAATCGLDLARFERDRADPRLDEKIGRDMELASNLKIGETPTIVIDGLKADLRWRAGVAQARRPNALIQRGIRESEARLRAGEDHSAVLASRIERNLKSSEKAARLLD